MFLLGDKYQDFMRHDAPVEFLEGTTYAGKTTVGVVKFMFKVAQSDRKFHVIAGLDLGTIEKNIINKDYGLLDVFGDSVEYYSRGQKDISMAFIRYYTPNGIKIIYVVGYDDATRWKKVLGGQYGCVFIDEINIADLEFIREISMRTDYLQGTLNPDDPTIPVYDEYINCSRPVEKWRDGTPEEILRMLNQPYKEGWTHWFFDFDDNISLTKEKKEQIINSVPKGTKIYKNKILGLRGKSVGLVFPMFTEFIHVKRARDIRDMKFIQFTSAVDTSYSQYTEDTIVFSFGGINENKEFFYLEELVLTNKDTDNPLSPSDVAEHLYSFLETCRKKWGWSRYVYVDSADQATLMELKKFVRRNPHANIYNFVGSWKATKIEDRIHLMQGWLNRDNPKYFVLDTCLEHIRELNVYSWKESKYEPEDKNDHTINASQYMWLPYKVMIGDRIDAKNN